MVIILSLALIGPPNGIARGVIAYQILIFGGASSKDAGIDGDGA